MTSSVCSGVIIMYFFFFFFLHNTVPPGSNTHRNQVKLSEQEATMTLIKLTFVRLVQCVSPRYHGSATHSQALWSSSGANRETGWYLKPRSAPLHTVLTWRKWWVFKCHVSRILFEWNKALHESKQAFEVILSPESLQVSYQPISAGGSTNSLLDVQFAKSYLKWYFMA